MMRFPRQRPWPAYIVPLGTYPFSRIEELAPKTVDSALEVVGNAVDLDGLKWHFRMGTLAYLNHQLTDWGVSGEGSVKELASEYLFMSQTDSEEIRRVDSIYREFEAGGPYYPSIWHRPNPSSKSPTTLDGFHTLVALWAFVGPHFEVYYWEADQ